MTQPETVLPNQAQLLAGVLDSSLDGIMAFRAVRDDQHQITDFQFLVINRRAEAMVGRTADQLRYRRLLDIFPGNKTDGLFDAYARVVETGQPFITEHHYTHDDLNTWFSISATPCGDGFTVTFADITERKAADERFRVLFECSSDAHLIYDETGIVDCNQAAVDMLGYAHKREILNIHPVSLSPTYQPCGTTSQNKKLLLEKQVRQAGFARFDWVHLRRDGSEINVEVTLNPVKLGEKTAMLVVWHDLTGRIETERRLRATTRHLAEAQELANIGSWSWSPANNHIAWSDQTKRIFGVPLNQPAPDFEAHQKQIHPDDLAHWRSVVEQAIRDQKPYTMKFRAVLPDGTTRVIEGRGRCELDSTGKVSQMYGTVQDVTEQESSREQIRTANERFELLVTGNASGIWDWDCKTDALYWSPRFKEMIGYAEDEIDPSYDDFESRLHPEDKDKTIAMLRSHIERNGVYDVEYRLRHKLGHYVWCHAAGQAQWDQEGKALRMAGSITDISERKASEHEVKKLSMVASRTEDGVVVTDAIGRVEWVNRAFTTITGYTLEEMRGQVPGRLLQGPGTDPATVARIREKIARQEGFRETLLNYRKNGEAYWVEVEVRPIHNEQGQLVNYMAIERDITDQLHREQEIYNQKRRLEVALVGSNTGLWDWRTQTGEVYFSDTWYTMLGYAPGELPMTFETWEALVHPDDLPCAVSAIKQYLDAQSDRYACEIRMRRESGDWHWVNTIAEAAERDEQGRVTRLVGVHVDIQPQKQAQAELAAARDLAEQASAAKSAFVANMSHEIRTPMNAILGYADLLLDPDQTDADKRDHAQTIRRNGTHLMDILNDVLDISKIEAGKMSVENKACAPHQLFDDVITLMTPKAIEKGIALELEAKDPLPDRVVTDPTRVRQVLLNLVGNAIKFTQQGTVRVVVHNRPQGDGSVLLACEVIDTGIGIAPEQLGQLFKPFSQADESTTRRFGGTGLGLAISHNLCALLGGELTCESQAGVGSTFTAIFRVRACQLAPQDDQADAPPALPNDAPLPLMGRRILVVEDAADNQRLIVHFLTKAGARVEVAANGALGRDAAIQAEAIGDPFELVLMDIQMPVLDGYSATQELRSNGYPRPIIALTANASASATDREQCLSAGCTDYLTKPIDRNKLIQTVARFLARLVEDGAGI